MLRTEARCPRCAGALKTVHNQSRWGRSLQLECRAPPRRVPDVRAVPAGEGAAPADVADRSRQAAARPRPIDCVNCGGALGKDDERCPLPLMPSLLDVARLARALDPSTRSSRAAVHRRGAPGRVAVRGVRRRAARRRDDRLRAVRRDARDHAAWPMRTPRSGARAGAARGCGAAAPDVVKRRLDALDDDLPRRREWVAAMQAEADARRGRGGDETDWRRSPLAGNPCRHPPIASWSGRMERRPALKSSSRGWRRRARRCAGGARPLAATGGAP